MFSRDYVGKWKNHYVLGKDLHLAKTVRNEVCNMSMIKKFCLPVVFLESYMGLSHILKNPLLYLHQLCGFLLLSFFQFQSPCSQATRKVRYMERMVGEGC